MPLPRRPLAALVALAGALVPASNAAADCPGGTPACPYTAAQPIGQASGGVLRFPQAVAVGPDGRVYVGDQGSHVVHVFNGDGTPAGTVGRPGTRSGELTAVGALATAGDGSLVVADGSNRLTRFSPSGDVLASWGRSGSEVGQFAFGGGRGNDAGAGGGLAVGGGFVYVADSGNDRLQRFDLDGGHGAEIGDAGQLSHPKGLAVRGSRLLVADDQAHRVVVMDTGGHVLKVVGAGNGTAPGQLNFPYGVATDAAGRVFVADDMNHRVVRFSSGPEYPYKGRFGVFGTAPGALAYPRALAVNAAGEILVADTGNDRIDVFDRGGQLLRMFGSSGRAVGQFNAPLGVAADASGVRAVVDSVNGRVQLLAPDGSVLTTWGSPAPGPTILPRPVAVAFDAGGNAFVLDQRRARIVVFDRATGQPARTIASQGSGPGQLLDPSALAIDAGGTIHVADSGNDRIARFAPDGSYLGAITGVGVARGIAVTPDGARVYVATNGNHITAYSQDGTELADFGGTGSKLGKFNAPAQMALDAAGNLWIADRGGNRVQQLGPEGQRLQSFGERGTGDGQFTHPTGVAIDCRGTLTVTDTDGNRVQQFALAAPAAPACQELAAPASPPPPKLPTLPAPDGPQLSFKPLRSTGVLAARGVPVRVGCDTRCSVTATATLTPAAAPPRRKKRVVVTLRAAKSDVPAGESAILRPVLTSKQAASLRKALRGRRRLVAEVQVVATAAVGAPTTLTQRLAVTR